MLIGAQVTAPFPSPTFVSHARAARAHAPSLGLGRRRAQAPLGPIGGEGAGGGERGGGGGMLGVYSVDGSGARKV